MKSPIHSFIKEMVDKEFSKLEKDKLTPWIFMETDHGLNVTSVDGSKVSYSGIAFSGTARQIFWERFSVPFFKDIISRVFYETRELCKSNGIKTASPLDDAAAQLRMKVESSLKKMVDIDRRLRGKGYPDSVKPYNPSKERAQTLDFLKERIEAEKLLFPKKSRLNQFYEEQKFWIWIIGLLVAISAIVVQIIG